MAVALWIRGALVPVIVEVKFPATVALHEIVEEPDPIVLVGLNDPQVRPGGAMMVKVTVPVNPLTAAIVTVEVGDWPALTDVGDVAVIVKSWNRRTTVAECSRDPLEPDIVRV